MSAALTPSTSGRSSGRNRSARTASAEIVRPTLIALSIFVAVAGIALGIALVAGATVIFNAVVWATFTVLWIAFVAALALSPGTLDDLWRSVRELPLAVQGAVWLLFLPLMIGLWVWERAWALPLRLVLILGLAAWNIFLFFPRSL